MADPDKLALLQAAAAGGTAGLARAQAEQAQAADGTPISAALAQAVGRQGLTPDAVSQLGAIERLPTAVSNDAGAMRAAGQSTYMSELDRLRNQFFDTQNKMVFPAIAAKLAFEDSGGGSSGGGGGGGGGSGGGGGGSGRKSKGSSSNDPTSQDWIKAARSEYGLVGSGVRSKTGLPPLLAQQSLQNAKDNPGDLASIALALPRDLRSRAWAESHFGATPDTLDKGAPVSGFLEKAIAALQQTIKDGRSYSEYAKATKKAAQGTPGDQRKAVAYALALAKQNLGQGGNPLNNAMGVVTGAPSSISPAIQRAVGRLF